jgi:hypothetical protein
LRERFYGFWKLLPLIIHEKPQSVAPGTTTKAIIKLFTGIYRKRRGFFVVEGTAGGKVLAGLFELHPAINNFDNIYAIE